MVNYDPTALFVSTDSKIKDVKELLEMAKANPGKMKASGTGQGGIWHLGLAGMLVDAKLPGNAVGWVPSQGAAPGLQDLVAGGIEIAACSLPEARSLIEAGKIRPLVLMSAEPDSVFPKVPLLKDVTGSNWTTGAWRGVAGPKGLPADVTAKLEAAVKKAYDSKAYQDFLKSRGFGAVYEDSKGFEAFMAKEDESKGAVMKAVGTGQVESSASGAPRAGRCIRVSDEEQRRPDRGRPAAAGAGDPVARERLSARAGPALQRGALSRPGGSGACPGGHRADRLRQPQEARRSERAAAKRPRRKSRWSGPRDAGRSQDVEVLETAPVPSRLLAIVLTAGAIVFYLLAANFLGFIITGALILAVLMWAYGVAFKVLLPVSIIGALVIHLAFYKLLSVPLPWGLLQPFAW